MAKWACYGAVSATKYLGIVEADTKEEAEEKAFALDSLYVSVCHACASEVGDPDITQVIVELEE